jgi:hypothetical protein
MLHLWRVSKMMGTFTIKCNKCGEERELSLASVGDEGVIKFTQTGDEERGTVEKFYINCSCRNWVEFDKY